MTLVLEIFPADDEAVGGVVPSWLQTPNVERKWVITLLSSSLYQ